MVLGSPVLPPPQPLRASIPVAAAAPKARRVSADPARGEPSEPGSVRGSGWAKANGPVRPALGVEDIVVLLPRYPPPVIDTYRDRKVGKASRCVWRTVVME